MITTKYYKRELQAHPEHQAVKNWLFEDDGSIKGEEKAMHLAELADAMAHVAEDQGLTTNDLMHIFPLVLRMLKVKNPWSGL